jgi:hypothetical protein
MNPCRRSGNFVLGVISFLGAEMSLLMFVLTALKLVVYSSFHYPNSSTVSSRDAARRRSAMIMASGHSDKEAFFDYAEDSVDDPQLIPSKESSGLKLSVSMAVKNNSSCTSKKTRIHELSTAGKASNEILKESAADGTVQRTNDPVDRLKIDFISLASMQ